jgi:hypothetical protein
VGADESQWIDLPPDGVPHPIRPAHAGLPAGRNFAS